MKNFWKILAYLTILGIINVIKTDAECPEPDCGTQDPGVLVPDPEECHNFYVCLATNQPSDVSFPCADGEYFSAVNSTCIEETTPCLSDCAGSGECHLTCDSNLFFINDANDCNVYYICLPGGETVSGNCPPEMPYFDSKSGNCTTDETVCCTACEPQCTEVGVQIPDPYDCFKFYACSLAPSIPDEKFHGTCPTGKWFDPAQAICVDGDDCTPICSGGGSGGSTPIGGSTQDPSGTTTLGPDGCTSSLTCTAVGNFPKCTTCQPEFFHCEESNGPAIVRECTGNLVFNPDPEYPFCILAENCPYSG